MDHLVLVFLFEFKGFPNLLNCRIVIFELRDSSVTNLTDWPTHRSIDQKVKLLKGHRPAISHIHLQTGKGHALTVKTKTDT